MDRLLGRCLMEIWGNFQKYKCQHPSYVDGLEEPRPCPGNREPYWRWFCLVIPAVMSLEVRSGGITKVQSDFLKLGSSDADLTLHLKQSGARISSEAAARERRSLRWKDLLKKKRELKYRSEASRQVSFYPVQDKWNCVLENTRRSIKKSSTGFRQKLLTLLAVWHLCKILLKANIIKLSILSPSFRAFSPPPHQIEMTSF